MTVLYFIPLLFLLLVPHQHLSLLFENLKAKFIKQTLLSRGESLLFWLDSFGLDGVGFDLGASLPEKGIYKSFGVHIHDAWERVQQRGGELNPYFRVIKSLLRVDLKRQAKESESLNLMRVQIILILLLVWLFLISLKLVVGGDLGLRELLAIGSWQAFGIFIGFFVIKKLKRKYFSPISELLEQLLRLHSLRFSGNISQAALKSLISSKDIEAALVFKRMEGLLNRWRLKGRGDFCALDELREDIVALSQHRSEKFLKVGPLFFFIWCCLFVVPVMFAASVLGLAGHLNV
jgi:hypothetical protein